VLEHGGSPGAGGGAQPVAQPGCTVEGLLGAGAEGQAAKRAIGAVEREAGEVNFVGAGKVLEQVEAPGPGGDETPRTEPSSTGEGVYGVFPEGQGVGRANAPATAVLKFTGICRIWALASRGAMASLRRERGGQEHRFACTHGCQQFCPA